MALQFLPVMDAEDIMHVAAMAEEVFHEHYAAIITKEQIDYWVEEYQSVKAITEQIHRAECDYFILNDGEVNVGYFAIKIGQDKLFLNKLYVLKEHRGNGYGRQAYQFMKGLCEAMELKQIYLYMHKKNVQSIAIFEKFGFHKAESVINDIGNDFVMDVYKMQENLS